jgi:hypothetical protein
MACKCVNTTLWIAACECTYGRTGTSTPRNSLRRFCLFILPILTSCFRLIDRDAMLRMY